MLNDFFILLFVAFIANGFSAFAGGGAGLLQLPALLFLGLPFSTALATHKIATVALGFGAVSRHYKEKILLWKLSLLTVICGVPGVILGSVTILQVNEKHAYIALGCLTIALGIYSVFKKELGLTYQLKNVETTPFLLGGIVFFIIGFLNGSLASGTGLFVTLWYIIYYGLDYKRAIPHTLTWVGILWNGSGALTLGVLGDVQWSWLPGLIIGSFAGGYLGSHFAILKGSALIKRAFEIVTISVGCSLIWKILGV